MYAEGVALLHSPLVTAATWGELPDALRAHGLDVVVIAVDADAERPYAPRYVASAALQLAAAAARAPLVLVGHSGAGPLLPSVGGSRRAARQAVGGYVFLDAGLPRAGASRLDLLEAEDRGMATKFRADLESGPAFPRWRDRDLVEDLPAATAREIVLGGMRPRGLDFFTEALPHPPDWPDAPCAYLRTSDTYLHWARVAELRGWAGGTFLPNGRGAHFAALREPAGLAASLVELLERA